jgi:hypothetical protein
VITGVEFSISATDLVNELAPPRCPDRALITKFALSSITITAGSVFLSFNRFDIKRITAPNEKMQIMLSYSLKISSIMIFVFFSNQIIPSEESLCFDCA